ncbi:hypothetical protein [Ciceribacter thiooxidans]|uniref:Uncharacterized protein n=1 Tax=Ciceribacter thiooxidans TaxID=1969821 RepID=A0ABV7I484_9HYPH|nr:hypothetical protein [Ciceribacter thiooxidans]
MAKYSVSYSCGHAAERQLIGKIADRQRYVSWAAENGLCPDCVKSDKLKAVEAAEVENDLPALSGSEKQIAWARQIRVDKIGEVIGYFEDLRPKVLAGNLEAFDAMVSRGLAALVAQGRAGWWIDNKDRSGIVMGMDAMKSVA